LAQVGADRTALSGSVLIPNDTATPGTVSVGLSGNGEQAAISSSGNITFTDVAVNTTSATRPLVLEHAYEKSGRP